MRILTALKSETLFHSPEIHKTSQQQTNTTLANKHSRWRGVTKIVFDVPMLHGTRFFWIAMQRGNAISHFCDNSLARTSLFSFFQHVPSEKVNNTENRIMKSCCGRVGAKGAKCKSPQKIIPAPKDTIGTHFLLSTNSIIHLCVWLISPCCITLPLGFIATCIWGAPLVHLLPRGICGSLPAGYSIFQF